MKTLNSHKLYLPAKKKGGFEWAAMLLLLLEEMF